MRRLARHPKLRGMRNFGPWSGRGDGVARLGDETGALCRLSGLVTEADMTRGPDHVPPLTDHILNCLGPARVMCGSDWTLCRLRCESDVWHRAAAELTAHLSKKDQARIFGRLAAAIYLIGDA